MTRCGFGVGGSVDDPKAHECEHPAVGQVVMPRRVIPLCSRHRRVVARYMDDPATETDGALLLPLVGQCE